MYAQADGLTASSRWANCCQVNCAAALRARAPGGWLWPAVGERYPGLRNGGSGPGGHCAEPLRTKPQREVFAQSPEGAVVCLWQDRATGAFLCRPRRWISSPSSRAPEAIKP